MPIVTVDVAQADLSSLIERACAGEEVIIARGSEPLVRLVPVARLAPKRQFGTLRGELVVPPSFFEPLPPDELEAWEGDE